MKTIGRFILILVLLTAFADLVPTIQDVLEPHVSVSQSNAFDSTQASHQVDQQIADLHAGTDHHHDGPCVGGHCHLGHCAFVTFSLPVVRFAAALSNYELKDSQVPSSPFLDTMKRPPRA